MTRLKDGPGEENNPIVQYQQWTEHQYDPGIMLFARDQKKRRQRRASQAQADRPALAHHKHSHGHGRFSDRHHRRDTDPTE